MARIISDHRPESVKSAIDCLKEGGVLLYPTDTIYGLGCDALNGECVNKLITIKGRQAHKPFILLTGSMDMIEQNFIIDDCGYQLKNIWPGPFTVLLAPKNPHLDILKGPNGKIGIRMADDYFLSRIFLKWDGLLVSTSANKSGVPYLHDWEVISENFQNDVNILIQREVYPQSEPSAVIEFRQQVWNIYREGPVPLPKSFNICK